MRLFSFLYDGVNLTIAGSGGLDCYNFLSLRQRVMETLFYSVLFIILLLRCLPKLTLPFNRRFVSSEIQLRGILLKAHCVIFAVELAFKIATKSFIWILNPCHVVTLIQIWLLSAPPCALVTAIFRIHFHMLNGTLLALLFPILNARPLPFQHFVYFAQHILILFVPLYLLDHNSIFSPEPFSDFSWVGVSSSLQVLYHFLFLQPIAMATQVNLNNMLCPAVSDPFSGPCYRMIAMVHQPFLILLLGKIISYSVMQWRSEHHLDTLMDVQICLCVTELDEKSIFPDLKVSPSALTKCRSHEITNSCVGREDVGSSVRPEIFLFSDDDRPKSPSLFGYLRWFSLLWSKLTESQLSQADGSVSVKRSHCSPTDSIEKMFL